MSELRPVGAKELVPGVLWASQNPLEQAATSIIRLLNTAISL